LEEALFDHSLLSFCMTLFAFFLSELGIAAGGLVAFPFKSCVSQLSVDQISRNFLYFYLSPQFFFQNLSTDGQENATFVAKNTNPHAAIPSSAS